MKWTRIFVALTILFAISANTTVAFSSSFQVFHSFNKDAKSSQAPHVQQHNQNLLFFLEEDFLEEFEEEFDAAEELPNYICSRVGTPQYLLRFLAAHRYRSQVKVDQFAQAERISLFIVYQVFRI